MKNENAEQPAQQEPEPDRVKFERHWRKTRGDKKANRELPRHPLQPQTYIQDSANRHWVTWQAAVRSVSPQPAQHEPVAWMHEWEDGERIPMLTGRDDRNTDEPISVRPLVYADTSPPAQRPWVGLSEEDREQHRNDWYSNIHDKEFRAIEAKLKEKNT